MILLRLDDWYSAELTQNCDAGADTQALFLFYNIRVKENPVTRKGKRVTGRNPKLGRV
jgi:hypothetical protein